LRNNLESGGFKVVVNGVTYFTEEDLIEATGKDASGKRILKPFWLNDNQFDF